MIQIKAAQDTLLADHAEDCLNDVASCLQQNNSSSYYYSSTSTYEDITDTAINACKSQIKTCMSTMGEDVSNIKNAADMKQWLETSLSAKTSPVTQIKFDLGGWASYVRTSATNTVTDWLADGTEWVLPTTSNLIGLTYTSPSIIWCWDTTLAEGTTCPDTAGKVKDGKCCAKYSTSDTKLSAAEVADAIVGGSKLYFTPTDDKTKCESNSGEWVDPLCRKK